MTLAVSSNSTTLWLWQQGLWPVPEGLLLCFFVSKLYPSCIAKASWFQILLWVVFVFLLSLKKILEIISECIPPPLLLHACDSARDIFPGGCQPLTHDEWIRHVPHPCCKVVTWHTHRVPWSALSWRTCILIPSLPSEGEMLNIFFPSQGNAFGRFCNVIILGGWGKRTCLITLLPIFCIAVSQRWELAETLHLILRTGLSRAAGKEQMQPISSLCSLSTFQ